MNEWVRKSIEFANGAGYLDRLHEVYPVTLEPSRHMPLDIKDDILDAFKSQDNIRLIKRLLTLEKFPIKDPYVAFLRKGEHFLEYNPKTVERIANELYSMGFKALVEGIEQPKEFNRQIGTLFGRWIEKLGYPLLPEPDFVKYEGIAILEGSNGKLKEYANSYLGCRLIKAPDLLAKAGTRFVAAEAKFLTDYGGHQNAQFADALRLLRGRAGGAIRIAILDGVLWIRNGTKMYRTVCRLKGIALSALLLKDFLESLF